jgi:replicative DNA helicase
LADTDFQSQFHGLIYGTTIKLINGGKFPDAIQIASEIEKSTGRSVLVDIIELINSSTGSSKNAKSYANMILSASKARQAALICNEVITEGCTPESVSAAVRGLMSLDREDVKHEHTIAEGMKFALTDIKNNIENPDKIIGVPTGLTEFDELLGGYHPEDLVIIGARPAMGKTAVMLNMALNSGSKVGIFSGEQGVSQVCQRMLATESSIGVMKMRSGKFEEDDYTRLNAGAIRIKEKPDMYFYDRPAPTINEIIRVARKWKFNHDIKAIYIDYVQRIKGDMKLAKHERVGEIAKSLKELARELKIPVIALAQVNRAVEARPDRRPRMGDLKDSGDIEQEADVILTLYRDEVYNPDTDNKGVIELIVEKNRHGGTGCIYAEWIGAFLQVKDQRPIFESQGY